MDSRFPRKRALSPTRGLVLFFVFVVGRESLGLFLSWAGGFGGADGDVEAVFAEGLFGAAVFDE